jgi:glutamine amidotransferase
MSLIGIVDYGLGNLRSVAGAVAKVGFEPVVSADPETLWRCAKLILPGVGAFGDGMRNLEARGLVAPLTEMVTESRKPLLGICLGSQLLTRSSEEFGEHQGLGWLAARVRQFKPAEPEIRVPHVGWNDLVQVRPSVLFEEVPEAALFYYVHSYYIESDAADIVIGECDYGARFAAALECDNIFATQFHPEKSQHHGLTLLKNFLAKA